MISVGNRDGRRGIEQEFSGSNNIRRNLIEESELEEGEACSYHDNNDAYDPAIDPDVTLSYIDEKLQNVLGHFQKDFEGLVSAESLGARYGHYGSFLPSYRRSPASSHCRSPPRIQNYHTPESSSNFAAEGAHHNLLAPPDVLHGVRHGSASSSSATTNAFKPTSQNDGYLQNSRARLIQEESTPKSEVRDQRTLKVRIKVGSDNLLGKKNSAIYTGLGLDGSPSPSFDDGLIESRKLTNGLTLDYFESPSHILRMMTSFPLFGGSFLSPLSDDLMHLCERPILLQHTPIKPSIQSNQLLSLQDKIDNNEQIGFGILLKDTDIDAVSCEELVSNALKLPLLCDSFSNKKEDVYSDAAKSLCEKPNVKVEAGKDVTASTSAKFIDHVKPRIPKSGISPSRKEQLPLKGKKKSKKGRNDRAGKAAVTSADYVPQMLKGGNISDTSTKYPAGGTEMLKLPPKTDVKKSKDRYADFFGDLNDQEDEVKESPDVFSQEKFKTTEVVGKTTLVYENVSREKTISVEDCRGATVGKKKSLENRRKLMSGTHLTGPSQNALVSENDRPISDPALGTDPDEWAECDKCRKWRLLPPGIKGDDLPEEWDCSMQTWLPDMNRCGINAEETDKVVRARYQVLPEISNSFHVPLGKLAPGTAADSLNTVVSHDGNKTGKLRKASKLSVQDNLDWLPSLSKEKPSVKGRTTAAVKDPQQKIGLGSQQQSRSNDMYPETNDRKKMKQRSDCHSDGGISKIPATRGKRSFEQVSPRTSKRNKTSSLQSGDNKLPSSLDHGNELFDVSSGYGAVTDTSGKDQVTNLDYGSFRNVKDQTASTSRDAPGRVNRVVHAFPSVTPMQNNKSDIDNIAPKKRKGDSFEGLPISMPSKKVMDDNEHVNSKRKKTLKSEGKDTSTSKRNSKGDRKRKSISNQIMDNNDTPVKVPSGSNLAATSSSSKVSGSLKVISKFQEVKGSPVESVSSSPSRSSHFSKLSSGGKAVVEKESVLDAVKPVMERSAKCSDADNEGSGGQSCPTRKDIIESGTDHKSLDASMRDKSNEGLRHKNGDLRAGNLEPDNSCPLNSRVINKCVNERERGENNPDYGGSMGRNQTSKPNLEKSENDDLHGSTLVHEERQRNRKISVQENSESNGDKSEKHTVPAELTYSDCKAQQEIVQTIPKKFDAAESGHLESISMKENLQGLPLSDVDRHNPPDTLQQYQGNSVSTSCSNVHPSNLPEEPRSNKKANQNGTHHVSSKQSISNGHRAKNQDVSSPHKRESSSQAASSAIKEAKNLKHLADRLKNADPTESMGLYFEAALKFLHGASLLESGKTENAKHGDVVQAMQMYSDTAKLCRFCAHEYEKSKDMATAALAYKCMEVAYMRVVYSSHNIASRDRFELQAVLQMVPPGESPSSSASDIDNLNNAANGDKAAPPRSFDSPLLAGNLVLAARNRQNFSRLLNYAQDVNSAMEASRKSRIAFAAASVGVDYTELKDGIASIKRALDFNFHDVEGLLRLVRLAKEATSR